MEERLIQYLKEKYNPRAILLHGSRASGNAREHSDWDFAIFVDKEIEGEREIFLGANIEIKVIVYPIAHIKELVPTLRKQNTKVLYDPENICPSIIEEVTVLFEKGREPDNEIERSGHSAWMRSHIDGMIDYEDEHLAFFRKLGEFYVRSIMYWFRFLHNEYMPQVYESIPRIKKDDPEYFTLLQVLAGNGSSQEKIKAAEDIRKRIFKIN